MAGQNVHLDSSAILKRYLPERGTEVVDGLFKEAEIRRTVLHFSIWNIGEVVGVLDKNQKTEDAGGISRISSFLNEFRRMVGNNSIKTIEITLPLVFDTASIVIRHKLYAADALQLVSCKYVGCDSFFTGDRRLHNAAKKEGLDSTFLG